MQSSGYYFQGINLFFFHLGGKFRTLVGKVRSVHWLENVLVLRMRSKWPWLIEAAMGWRTVRWGCPVLSTRLVFSHTLPCRFQFMMRVIQQESSVGKQKEWGGNLYYFTLVCMEIEWRAQGKRIEFTLLTLVVCPWAAESRKYWGKESMKRKIFIDFLVQNRKGNKMICFYQIFIRDMPDHM